MQDQTSKEVRLVYSGLVYETTSNVMPQNALIAKSLPVSGDRWSQRSNQSNLQSFMFRLSKSHLRNIYDSVKRGGGAACDRVSELYQSGLALPKDELNALIWKNLSGYDAVQIGDEVLKKKFMLKVLREHINQSSRYCEVYVPTTSYLKFMRSVAEQRIAKTGKAKFTGNGIVVSSCSYDIYAVYKNFGSECQLVSVFLSYQKIKDGKEIHKLVDFTYQGTNLVKKILPTNAFGGSDNYYVVYGKLEPIKGQSFDYAETVNQWIRLDLDRLDDLYRERADVNSPHIKWLNEYRAKNGLAVLFLNEFKNNPRPTKKDREKAESAQKLIAAFERKRLVNRELRREARVHAKADDPSKKFEFVAVDLFLMQNNQPMFPNVKFEKIQEKLQRLGFKVAPNTDKVKNKNGKLTAVRVSNKWHLV